MFKEHTLTVINTPRRGSHCVTWTLTTFNDPGAKPMTSRLMRTVLNCPKGQVVWHFKAWNEDRWTNLDHQGLNRLREWIYTARRVNPVKWCGLEQPTLRLINVGLECEPYPGAGYTCRIYRERDLSPIRHIWVQIVQRARQLWREETDKFLAEHGDIGTCVLGAGIEVQMIPKGCRNAKYVKIIPAPGLQGASAWEDSVERIVWWLKACGIEASYDCGRMD